MKYLYEFVGGPLSGRMMQLEEVEQISNGNRPYYGRERALGYRVPREELDGQPTVEGYLGPMWDGLRYEVLDGSLKSEWQLTEEEKAGKEPIAILRYESHEIYKRLSD